MSYWKENTDAKSGPMVKLKVSIDEIVWQKINHWVQKAPGEVSGLGKVVQKDGVFRIIDAVLVKQENGMASTELDPQSVGKVMYELRETPGHLNFWWHSHVDMGVFWSGTDTDTIREIGQNGWLVSTVFNKKREMLSSIYVAPTEVLPEIFFGVVETEIQSYLPKEVIEQWDKEYTEKCTPKVYASSTYQSRWGTDGELLGYGGDYGNVGDYGKKDWGNGGSSATETEADAGTRGTVTETVSDDAPELPLNEVPQQLSALNPNDPLADPLLNAETVEDWVEEMEEERDDKRAQRILRRVNIGLKLLELKGDLTPLQLDRLTNGYFRRFSKSRAKNLVVQR